MSSAHSRDTDYLMDTAACTLDIQVQRREKSCLCSIMRASQMPRVGPLLELEPGLSYPCTAHQPPDRLQSASQGAETKRPKTVMGTVPRSKKAELSQLV